MEMENTRAGIAGTIDLRPGDAAAAATVDLTGNVHLLPCSIKRDGPCPVSDYFKPKPSGSNLSIYPSSLSLVEDWVFLILVPFLGLVVDGLNVEEAFFRGRKMQGATVELPEGFQGNVCVCVSFYIYIYI